MNKPLLSKLKSSESNISPTLELILALMVKMNLAITMPHWFNLISQCFLPCVYYYMPDRIGKNPLSYLATIFACSRSMMLK